MLESNDDIYKNSNVGVAIFDIDDFKIVNDTYGHLSGDHVLEAIADLVKDNLNATVCRWGGEEFVVVFKKDDVSEADLLHVKDLISEKHFSSGEDSFKVTVSIGAFIEDERIKDNRYIDYYIDCADKALYRAKRSGKNKLNFF